MAKKQQSAADDAVDLVASFPWWVGVALAAISYFVLHHFAAQKPHLGVAGSAPLRDSIINSAATVGQFLLPLFCVLGALKSLVSRARRRKLIDKIPASNPAAVVNLLNWQDFELLVGQAFRMQGYAVTETGQAGADGGIDLVLTKGRERTLVQCKHWRAQTVGVAIVRELYGAMAADSAVAGIVVTSGRFSADAKAFASGRNVNLIDGQAHATLIDTAKDVTQRDAAWPMLARLLITPQQTRALESGLLVKLSLGWPRVRMGNELSGEFDEDQCRTRAPRHAAAFGENALRSKPLARRRRQCDPAVHNLSRHRV